MSLLQSAPSLLGFGHSNRNSEHARPRSAVDRQPQKGEKSLPSSSSIASLIDFVRNPTQTVGEAVENWYDGTTKEERDKRQALEDRKQLLYLKMRVVRMHCVVAFCVYLLTSCSRRLHTRTGKQPQRNWTI